MKAKQTLITGGAGFVGSHLADELLRHGYHVRALDSLVQQVHGSSPTRPSYLDPAVDLVVGDIREPEALERALEGVDIVFHFAASVGVGQSMYQAADYLDVNTVGTALLLEALARDPVERLVVASSMSIYGEGLYIRPDGTFRDGARRAPDQLRRHEWDLRDGDGDELTPVPTPETKPPVLESVYALSKYDQERLCLTLGPAYGIPTVALRFFNIYGPRQALSNPYTGVLAIFASRLLNGKPPLIFEDGEQRRDFVHVSDVARACRLAVETENADGEVVNVGSGEPRTISEVARHMAEATGRPHVEPEITGEYRVGDIRHCYADIQRARRVLGYEPQVSFDDGVEELAAWLDGKVAVDRVSEAREELAARGLTR